MQYLYSIEQMRALERKADAAGHSYATMMEQAGQGVAAEIQRRAPQRAKVVVLAGPGNNGGDGLVAARVLAEQKFRVVALVWRRASDDPLLQAAQQAGVSILRDATASEQAGPIFMNCDVGIDALFGTGLTRPITGDMAAALSRLAWARRHSNRPTLLIGVDGPSGLHGDTGKLDPLAVPVDISITFAGPKVGMVANQAVDAIGELRVVDIGIPDGITAQAEKSAEWLSPAWAKSQLPPRPRSGHKGTFGTVLVVGGSQNYAGAPALSALAAGRSGVGYVTLATPEPLYRILAARSDLTTATWLPLPHDFGVIRSEAIAPLREALAKVQALVLGVGIGQEEPTRDFFYTFLNLKQAKRNLAVGFVKPHTEQSGGEATNLPPTVLDADALNLLASYDGAWWEQLTTPMVLTPHPGEFARLTGQETQDVQADRLQQVQQAAQKWGQTVVLKGAYSIVASPDNSPTVAPFATDALAKAGAGDVLSGMIGALLAQGLEPFTAARVAVVAHGLAGERLRDTLGGRGAIASDLIEQLPGVWRELAK